MSFRLRVRRRWCTARLSTEPSDQLGSRRGSRLGGCDDGGLVSGLGGRGETPSSTSLAGSAAAERLGGMPHGSLDSAMSSAAAGTQGRLHQIRARRRRAGRRQPRRPLESCRCRRRLDEALELGSKGRSLTVTPAAPTAPARLPPPEPMSEPPREKEKNERVVRQRESRAAGAAERRRRDSGR